jgi:hypothetical protein
VGFNKADIPATAESFVEDVVDDAEVDCDPEGVSGVFTDGDG